MDILEGLNEAQRLAVTTTEGPVMVMAGAGSGKTKVLTTRIAYLISELNVSSSAILSVTFTNKAAKEMKDRIGKMLDIETQYMWVSTFHAFCSRLLRIEMNHLPPFTNRFNIIDDEDSLKIVKTIMKENSIDDFKPKEIRNQISKNKNFKDFSISDPHLNRIFTIVDEKYHQYLKENNLLDFDDLILMSIRLFKENPDVLEKYQRKFEYILVDEFQDTNSLQYDLIFMLASRHHNLFVVGDDFQSIYSFRGAKIENIYRFREFYIDHKLILLEENYRSSTQILNLANSIIKNNPKQIKKVMFSSIKNGELPFYYHANSSYEEVMFVIDKIKALIASGQNYKDFAILYRANYISRSFEDMLVRYQIPYKIYGGLSFFARKEVKDILAYLRVLIATEDNFSFLRIINEPKRKIGPTLLEKLTNCAYESGLSLYDAIDVLHQNGQGGDSLRGFKAIMDEMKEKINEISLPTLVEMIIKNTGYEEALKKDEDTYADRIANIKELKSVVKEAEEFYDGDNTEKLSLLLSDLALRTNSDNDDLENDDCVRLSTYHQVKGLEFRNVFMVAMEEGIFPSMNCISESEIEEERRICYVGITRAKDKLFLSNAEQRFLFGSQSYQLPSRFIKEMSTELMNQNVNPKMVQKKPAPINKSTVNPSNIQQKRTTSADISFVVGDKINHKAFGDGLVVQVADQVITVAFKAPTGLKKLVGTHPSIRKL